VVRAVTGRPPKGLREKPPAAGRLPHSAHPILPIGARGAGCAKRQPCAWVAGHVERGMASTSWKGTAGGAGGVSRVAYRSHASSARRSGGLIASRGRRAGTGRRH